MKYLKMSCSMSNCTGIEARRGKEQASQEENNNENNENNDDNNEKSED